MDPRDRLAAAVLRWHRARAALVGSSARFPSWSACSATWPAPRPGWRRWRGSLERSAPCRHVLHYDLEWNPAKLEQREGRVDRKGRMTDGPVNVYFLLCRGTYHYRINHGAGSVSPNKYKLVRPGMLLNFGTSSAAVRGDMITTDLLLPLCRKPRFLPTAWSI